MTGKFRHTWASMFNVHKGTQLHSHIYTVTPPLNILYALQILSDDLHIDSVQQILGIRALMVPLSLSFPSGALSLSFPISIEGVIMRCRLSLLTNSAIVYEPKCGGGGCGVSANEYNCAVCTWSQNKLWRSNSIFNLCHNSWVSTLPIQSQNWRGSLRTRLQSF
jgi:hypothetical protein